MGWEKSLIVLQVPHLKTNLYPFCQKKDEHEDKGSEKKTKQMYRNTDCLIEFRVRPFLIAARSTGKKFAKEYRLECISHLEHHLTAGWL